MRSTLLLMPEMKNEQTGRGRAMLQQLERGGDERLRIAERDAERRRQALARLRRLAIRTLDLIEAPRFLMARFVQFRLAFVVDATAACDDAAALWPLR
jgi:hypothetical protein